MKKIRLEVLATQVSKRLRKIPKNIEKLLRERDRLEMQLAAIERVIKNKKVLHETLANNT